MTRMLNIMAALVCVTGCTLSEGVVEAPSYIPPSFTPPYSARAAVVCGLTRVNPASYGGWNGDCPGSDVDAAGMTKLLTAVGIQTITLTNSQATRFRFLSACAEAATAIGKSPSTNPLLIVYISGHGGQQADVNGDEDDLKDETLCLWDGPLTDDILWAALLKAHSNVRVVFISDSCNSSSNYKAVHDYVKPMNARSSRAETPLLCSLIHYGGCGDGLSSYGSLAGGEFTTSLLDTYYANLKSFYEPGWVNLTWKTWFEAASKRMPRNQVPVYAELGAPFGDEGILK